MKPEVLRIGHFYVSDMKRYPFKEHRWTIEDFVKLKSGKYELTDYGTVKGFHELSLSDRWIEKLKFNRIDNVIEREGIELVFRNGTWVYYYSRNLFVEVRYVHMLQDLYLTLKQKNIEIE